MSYFDDILNEEKERMDYQFFGQQFKDAHIPIGALKINSKLQDGTAMSQQFEMKHGKPAGYRQPKNFDFNVDAEMSRGDYTFLASKKDGISVEFETAPEGQNKDGKHMTVGVNTNWQPKKGDFSFDGNVKYGGLGNDTVKSWSEISFAGDLGLSQNFAIKNDDKTFHLGLKCSTGLFQMNSLYGQLVASGFSWGKVWMRANLFDKMVALGSTVYFDKNYKHEVSSEVAYDVSGKNKGLMDLPLFMRIGQAFHYKNGHTLNHRLNIGRQWIYTMKYELPVDKNTTFWGHYHMDLKQLSKTGNADFKFGQTIEINL